MEAESVRKIDESISGVAQIVDNNSASSEETAAVSEEQSAQVQTMVQLMEQSKFKNNKNCHRKNICGSIFSGVHLKKNIR